MNDDEGNQQTDDLVARVIESLGSKMRDGYEIDH